MPEVFIIMEKDGATGALSAEIASCEINSPEYVAGLFCVKSGSHYEARLLLSVAAETEPWQYDAIYDYYDEEVFANEGLVSFNEDTRFAKPVWEASLNFSLGRESEFDDVDELEKKINDIIEIHKKEVADVFIVIADKKDEYPEDEEI